MVTLDNGRRAGSASGSVGRRRGSTGRELVGNRIGGGGAAAAATTLALALAVTCEGPGRPSQGRRKASQTKAGAVMGGGRCAEAMTGLAAGRRSWRQRWHRCWRGGACMGFLFRAKRNSKEKTREIRSSRLC